MGRKNGTFIRHLKKIRIRAEAEGQEYFLLFILLSQYQDIKTLKLEIVSLYTTFVTYVPSFLVR